MPIKKTKEEYIEEATKIHNYKYDYCQIIELPKRDFRVNIICLQHGIFEQSFHKHLSGDGCKKCANEKLGKEKIEKAKNKFINDVTIKHNNKYDYSKINYISAKEKIIIICPIHGDFKQTPNSHLNGNGCGKCANEKTKERMSIPWNIYKEDLQKIHNNKYNYSKVIWKGVDIDIIVECPTHGEFEIRPADHKRERGCPTCSKENFIPHNKFDTQKFIEKSIEIWGNKYNYSKTKYVDSLTKVIIMCHKHGEFEQLPQQHYKYECELCSYEKKEMIKISKKELELENKQNNKSDTQKFIEKSIEIWGNKYNYSKIEYINSLKNVIIICKSHGEFLQSPGSHLQGHGCYTCGRESVQKNNELIKKKSENEFKIKSNNIHCHIYDYTKSNYIDAKTKLIVVCKEHGEFNVTPNNHLRGKGCPECGKIKSAISKIKPYDEYLNEFIKLYGNKYDYSLVKWEGASCAISVICNNHGLFDILPYMHKIGKECPKCSNRYSLISIEWLSYMEIKNSIKIIHAKNEGEFCIPNSRYKADGYCKETNTIYEFHGDFWHGNPKKYNSTDINKKNSKTFGELYQNTLNKEQQIRDMGFNLITIWESDWIKLNKCIKILQRKFRNSKLY